MHAATAGSLAGQLGVDQLQLVESLAMDDGHRDQPSGRQRGLGQRGMPG
ncbi:hypothetical protein ACFFMN_42555 [Planobispora siamensis]|nr:hypothetical protein [Planobispora siamensis]